MSRSHPDVDWADDEDGPIDLSRSLRVSGSRRSLLRGTHGLPNDLSRALQGTLRSSSGAGFSKTLMSLDAQTKPRACAHRLNVVRPPKSVGFGARVAPPSMRDAWWGMRAAQAAASRRAVASTMVTVKAASKFSKLLAGKEGGKSAGEEKDRSGSPRSPRSPRAGGAYGVERVVRVTEEEVEAQREHVWALWEKVQPAREAAYAGAQALAEKADELWEETCRTLTAVRVGDRPEDKEFYELTKIQRPTRTLSAAAACVNIALDCIAGSMPINAYDDEPPKTKSKHRHMKRSGPLDSDDGESWRTLIDHQLFGSTEMIDNLMGQLFNHAAWLAWEGAGEVLKNAEDIESSPSGTDVSYEYEDEASNPKGLPMQCVRLATRAFQDPTFGISGACGAGDEVENGVLRFLITWTRHLALIDRKMNVAKRQHGPRIKAYRKLVSKHDKASRRMDELDAAYSTMRQAEEALEEEEEEEEAQLVKLHR